LKTGRIVGLANHTVLISKDGAERLIADSGAPIRDEKGDILGTVLVFRDISEQRKMEEDIIKLRTERMESISILAGGIAHDFNNILTAILGSVNLAKMHVVDSLVKEKLVKIEKASIQAKDLTQQLLTFSKGGAPIKKVTSLVELIKDSTTFALRGSKVKCQFSIPKTLWPAEVDEGQIGQMISNLLINADQAMPEGGTVQVQAENVVISSDCEVPLNPGRYIQISVEDQGIGIPKQYLTKIFDPYFTTKQEGSGLGLATSYSIIKNHGGCITVESHVGVGTMFHVYLPASAKQLKTEKEEKDTLVGGKGRVLLMDDEESILEVTGEVLTYLGYEVEVARDGLEALELYKKAKTLKTPFDAVIIDLTIRGKMGGRETIQHLLKIDPSAKAIVSSGYSDDPVMANYRDYGFKGVVSKPYTIKELSEALREVLE
jgi:signal transduction histidine kinase/CheY-like chemotaxis protein